MPCDSVVVNRVELPKMAPQLTEATLKDAGATDIRKVGANTYTFNLDGRRWTLSNGELTTNTYDAIGAEELAKTRNKIARAYSGQVVQVAAAKNNWTVKKTGERQFLVNRR